MLETIFLLAFLISPFVLIILFIFCACKLSSMCSRMEELEEIKRYMKK